jgi:RNA polymerase sigma factor (sigma-70 family)
MIELNDEELLSVYFKEKSQPAFKLIFERHSDVLFSFIYRFTKDPQSANEIVQDVFAELIAGKFTESFQGSLKSWLFTVSRNKSLNFIKKKSFEVVTDSQFEDKVDSANLEENIIHFDLLDRLKRTEAMLPQEILNTWNLRKQGLDNNQIAEKLSIPVGTVKSRFFRLVEIIKQEWRG